MPIIHRAQIEHPNSNFKTVNLLPRSKSESTTTDYVVLIVLIVALPLANILIWAVYRLVLLYKSTGTSRNGDRTPRKLRKRRSKQRSIEVRNQTHDQNEDDNSVNGNMPDDINLSLLPILPSVVCSESMYAPPLAASETFPLMRGSAVISTMDSSSLEIGPSTRTRLEELEDRVQRLEGIFTIVPLGSEDDEDDIRAEYPPPDEEQLPAYTPRPVSFIVPRVVSTSSSGWTMVY